MSSEHPLKHPDATKGKEVSTQLVVITSRPVLSATVFGVGALAGPGEDLVTLELEGTDISNRFEISPAEFATPLSHSIERGWRPESVQILIELPQKSAE